MHKRVVLKIYGRVQGVFFRDSCRGKAEKLGLRGSVRNEPDGTVGIVAEGEEIALKELIKWCQDGSEHAQVEKIEEEWSEATGEFRNFGVEN